MKKSKPTAYRRCVGVMLLNDEGLVWVGRRIAVNSDDDEGAGHWWQMPQGGIDKGESGRDAALRELKEETGVVSAEIIAEASETFKYDLPAELVGVAWKGKYCGQEQSWFALRFNGDEKEIDISGIGHAAEFDEWKWVEMAKLPELIVPFKRDVYKQVVKAFSHLI